MTHLPISLSSYAAQLSSLGIDESDSEPPYEPTEVDLQMARNEVRALGLCRIRAHIRRDRLAFLRLIIWYWWVGTLYVDDDIVDVRYLGRHL